MDFASLSILLYLAPPLLSLAVLSLVRRSWVLLSFPFTLAVDLLVWGKALVYNHGEFLGLSLLFLIQLPFLPFLSSLPTRTGPPAAESLCRKNSKTSAAFLGSGGFLR